MSGKRYQDAPCAEIWFEPLGWRLEGESSLRIIFAQQVRGENIRLAFSAGEASFVLRFDQIAVFKGRQVFEATELHLEGASGPSPQDPLFQPSGPFQGGR